jgi:formylglycine-generating enzyme required for sulfatase activity
VFDVRVQPQRARELTAYERALQTSGVVKVDGRQGSGSLKRVLDLGGGQELTLLWVEPGEFLMGSPTTEVGRDKDEPLHRVILTRDFFLGETEVTQAQWKAVMGTEPWKGQEYVKEGANLAASYISYDEALEFCKRLNWSQQAGQRPPVGWIFGLPSEAQWEYACRAGTTTAYCSGDSELDLARVAVYYGNKDGDYAHPVRTKAPNDWGFFDMHGNVWEWTADAGSDGKSFVDGEKDPLVEGPSSAPRVVRGGSWYDNRSRCRSAYRFWSDPRNRSWIRGFRLCLLPGPGAPPEAK